MPEDIRCSVAESSFLSRGVLPRVCNLAEAAQRSGTVNHITGDVHFLALGLPKDCTILTVHDCGSLHRLTGLRRVILRIIWFRWPCARVRVVTTISHATGRELVNLAGCSAERIRVIPDCVSPSFTPAGKDAPFKRWKVLMVGTAPNKNLERMAEGLRGLDVEVDVAGNPPTQRQKDAFMRNAVRLRELGNLGRAEILEAYRRCDLLLFASTFEGFGMPILEAQAIGRPVITSRVSAMPEVAGEGACLVNPFEPASIRSGIERVMRDASFRQRLITNGYENVKRFSARSVASRYADIYREIAADRRQHRANRRHSPFSPRS